MECNFCRDDGLVPTLKAQQCRPCEVSGGVGPADAAFLCRSELRNPLQEAWAGGAVKASWSNRCAGPQHEQGAGDSRQHHADNHFLSRCSQGQEWKGELHHACVFAPGFHGVADMRGGSFGYGHRELVARVRASPQPLPMALVPPRAACASRGPLRRRFLKKECRY